MPERLDRTDDRSGAWLRATPVRPGSTAVQGGWKRFRPRPACSTRQPPGEIGHHVGGGMPGDRKIGGHLRVRRSCDQVPAVSTFS
jgi:hypothetical protein